MTKPLQRGFAYYLFFILASLSFSELHAQTGPAGVSSGIKLWLDGSNVNNTSPSTNPAANTAVTVWKDISGNNNDATVFGGQSAGTMNSAAINGRDAVKFTRLTAATGSVYNVAGVDIRKGTMPKMTVFTMYRPGDRNPGEQHALWGNDNGAYDRFIYSGFYAGAGALSDANTLSNPLIYLSNTHVPGTSKLLTAVYDSANVNASAIYLDGFLQNLFTDSTNNTAAQTTLRIGWDGDNGNYNGDIAEMVVYNRVLTDCELKAVTRYFARKYGLPFSSAAIVGQDTLNTVLCTGTPVTLTASPGTSYQWLQNGSAIGGATASTYTTAAAGNYAVVVTTNGCPDTSVAKTVSLVNIATSAQILYTPDTTISCGDSTTLYVLPAHNNGKDFLATGGAANNQREGNMFDIFADNPVTIEGFDVNVTPGPCIYSIYTRPGTHVGFEGSQTGWTLLGTFNLTGNGFGTYTRLPIKINTPIAQGQTQAFYLTVEALGSTTGYFNGTAVGDVWAQDNNIRVLDGTGRNNVFGGAGGSFSPRCFIGRVHYSGYPVPLWNTGAWNDTIKVRPFATTNYSVILGWSQSGCPDYDTQKVVVIPDTMYVDAAIPASGTGKSWASPFKTVTEALYYANQKTCNTSIWVKRGTYYPMINQTTIAANRDSSFRILRGDLKLYGGFAGTETAITQRNISANPTILSGDIGIPNNSSDNVYHVITVIPNDPVNGITIDGFTIQGAAGYNAAGTFVSNGITTTRSSGGGVAMLNANLTLDNNIIQFNTALNGGGVLSSSGGGLSAFLRMSNDSIADNFAPGSGGGVTSFNADLTMNNVSCARDTSDFGGGTYAAGANAVTVTGCRFLNNTSGNGGGGLYVNGSTNATVKYAVFAFNKSLLNTVTVGSGGGYQQSAATVSTFSNCVFANNGALGTADDGGGGMMIYGGTSTISDCTFSDNTTASTVKPNAGGISSVAGTTVNLNNNIVWGPAANQLNLLGTANYAYNDIRGLAAGGTNINLNPSFINPADPDGADNVWGTADDGLELTVCAPPVNKGSNALIPAGITTDMTGGARIQQTTVDMGAYESNLTPSPVLYVDGSVAVSGNGTSWASPLKTVSQALDLANFSNCANEIWVKAGTYYPMISPTVVTTNRDSSFRILRNGIKIYGGFAGTETLLTQRNVAANPTILSGDIGVAGNASDNVYHVFTIVGNASNNINNTTTVDGFTIRDGSNNGAGFFTVNGTGMSRTDGGGMLLAGGGAGNNCSPLIQNITFTNNAGTFGCALYCNSSSSGVSSPTINNCSFISNSGSGGAAMSAFGANSSPIVTNCTFTSNTVTGNGGAVDMNGSSGVSSPVFTSCTFTNNRAGGNGGAASNSGAVATPSLPQYINCIFTNNSATSNGGGISASTVNISVTGTTMTHNTAVSSGGGIYGITSTVTLTNDSLNYNFGSTYGGGAFMSNCTSAITNSICLGDTAAFGAGVYTAGGGTMNADNCKFFSNRAGYGTNSGGGGYCNDGATATLTQCIFYNNSAKAQTGNFGSGGGLQQNLSGATNVYNCVFANNNAMGTGDDGGGAIMIYGGGTFNAEGCTFSENITASTIKPNANAISSYAGPVVNISNSIIWGAAAVQNNMLGTTNYAYSDVKGVAAAGTNISSDPLFIDATDPDGADNVWGTSDDGLKLINCSPAINTGSNALIPGVITTDITAGPRILQAIVDMGAYENLFVTPPVQSVTITITAGAQTICPGTSVTFTATPVNGGATPFYQWQVNGVNAGTNSNTFTSTTLANNDVVTVIMTSSLICFTPPTATSNSIQMTVIPNVAPSVTIAITAGTQTICAGTSVTFTATPVNGGASPSYQWQVNGINAGTNSNTFTSTTLANGDVVTVILTSNAACAVPATATSNSVSMTVNPNLTPSVSIAITAGTQTICAGTSVTFTATPTNGGASPSYQWQVNGVNTGTNSNTFTSTTLANNDAVTVIMTSNAGCLASNNPVSNSIVMTVNSNLTPSVSIAITTGSQTICAGTSVTFTATPTNGGASPSYQWQVNGVNAGTNSNTFTSSTLANGDAVTVIMTSNAGCLASNNPVSNSIVMTVNTNLTPSVTIAITSGAQTICAGTSVTFTATPTNGGSAPVYQWKINGVNAGTNSPTFTSTALANGDVVTVVLTSNLTCLATNNVTSNAITMTVNPNLTPTVSIAITSGAQTICAGTSVTFTATITNGGPAPSYQWKVNGVNAGTNSNTFTSSTLANGDVVTVVLTSNATCLATNNVTSNSITMTVNPNLTPTVSIAITSGAQTICAGTSVTFTATITNGGPAPSYQWKVNGVNAGTNSNTFTSSTLANGDVVTVVLTSNATCLATNNVTSNAITMTVNPNLTPTVSIAITAGAQTICAGTSVTFTATITNGGTAPVYQWKVNGVNAGTNSNTFTSSTLANGDVVTVVLTSNETCLATNNVTSNAITMTVNPNLTPSVNIAITAGAQTICAGTSVTFTATPTNGGAAPAYQWKVNGVNAGTNSNTFTSTALANGDIVTVVLTSNATCLATNNVTSNAITMTVNPNLTPSVSIAITSGAQTICAGTSVTFTATPTNGGTAPAYQWKINGVNAGTNSNTFTSSTLANGDVVTVVLTSNETCLATNNVTSNAITMTVNPNLTPTASIAITSGSSTICAGTSVTFTATITNGGTAPVYQWKINGVNAGTNSNTFTSSTLANGDVITVVLTSNETCLATNNVTSNAITMTVNPNLTPSVSIAITAGSSTTCALSPVTFTATPTNGGSAPAYQWQVNGLNAGTNSSTFTTNALTNGAVVTVILTSNETCLTTNNVTSNAITMTVNPNVTPAVSISTPTTIVCSGDPVTFTATPVNGGSTPSYQWRVNSTLLGLNSPVFTYAGFATGDNVTVVLTSSLTCVTAQTALSNVITMTLANTPVLTLTADNTEILAGGVTTLHAASSEPISIYSWTPSFSLNNSSFADPVAAPDQTTLYTLVATSNYGCKANAGISIKVGKGPQIANTITPNNDGVHDTWEIKNLETYPDCRVQIFTRTGQLIFESRGYRTPWNGTYRGKPLPFDTYYYVIELNNRIGSKPITGYVTIVK